MFFTTKRDRQFFTLLVDATQNLTDAAKAFTSLTQDLGRARELAPGFKDMEKRGDRYTHDLITLLNKLFVTPFDREDILQLAVMLDDVVDGIEAAVSRLAIYRVTGEDRYITQFAVIIQSQGEEIVQAVGRLQSKELLKIRENAVQINILENQADELLRECLAHLFDHETDAHTLIKLKELYETLENVTDRAEDVANSLESVVMKNA